METKTNSIWKTAIRLFCIGMVLTLSSKFNHAYSQNVGISPAGTPPNASAGLDIDYTNKGVLIPRVALVITTSNAPVGAGIATSLLVYNTATINDVTPGFYYWNGAAWVRFMTGSGSSNDWTLLGNAGTSPATNFMGTTDNNDVIFKRFNVRAGLLNSASYNTSWGVWALNPASTGGYNTGIGAAALNQNTSGYNNTSVGGVALTLNTTGFQNTAVGVSAMQQNIAASNNVAIGAGALFTMSYNPGAAWSSDNVAVGYNALYQNQPVSNFTGRQNTAIGNWALFSNTTGIQNTAGGYFALRNNTTGISNTAFGWFALRLNITGDNNTAIGENALGSNTSGYSNTAVGITSLTSNTIGINNTAVGQSALNANVAGSYNTAVGREAMMSNTASNNTALGYQAMIFNTAGTSNTAVGYSAGSINTTGGYNTFLGYYADASAGTLTNATAIGANAYVGASNSMILGSINGVNGATAHTFVGIGTTTPSTKLHIESTTSPAFRLVDGTQAAGRVLTSDALGNASWLPAGAGGGDWLLTGNTGLTDGVDNFFGTLTAVPIRFVTNGLGNERMRITPTGRVGINTSVPWCQTVIEGGADGVETVLLNLKSFDAGGVGVNTATTLRLSSTSLAGDPSYFGGVEFVAHRRSYANGEADFILRVSGPVGFGPTLVERMRVTADGDVGIGTNSPNTVLDINGSLAYREGAALALVSGANNNVSIVSDYSFYRITGPAAAFTITGITNGYDGKIVTLYNTTSQVLTIANDNAGSVAANRIMTMTGGNITTPAGPNVIQLQYNANVARWLVIGGLTDGSGSEWLLLGNANTIDGTNFIGTTDAVPFNIRVNNLKSGRIDNAGNGETSFGYLAGQNAGLGLGSSFFGTNAGNAVTTGLYNTAVGGYALANNQTGQNNVAIGNNALRSIAGSSCSDNTAVGVSAMGNGAIIGPRNVAVGTQAMYANTNGQQNSATGYYALRNNTIGSDNTADGYMAMGTASPQIGIRNTAMGSSALTNNSAASQNTAIGFQALFTQTFWNAAPYNTDNVAIGYQALYTNNPTLITNGIQNTALGYQAGFANTTGTANTYIGYYAQGTALLTNATAIGNRAYVTANNSLILGSINGLNGASANTNVGIGTTAPASTLHSAGQIRTGIPFGGLGGALATVGSMMFYNATNTNTLAIQSGVTTASYTLTLPTAQGAVNTFLRNDGAGNLSWVAGAGGGWGLTGNAGTAPATNFIGTTDAVDFVVRTSNTEVMRVTAGAKVGIGITTPTAKFVVLGAAGSSEPVVTDAVAVFSKNATSVTNSFIGIIAGGNGSVNDGNAGIHFGCVSFPMDGSILYNNNVAAGRFMAFRTSGAERMRITSAGYVGIGTTAPGGQLELSLDQGRKPSTNTWTTVSDERLKTITGPYEKGLGEIIQLRPVSYYYKNEGDRKFADEVLNTLNVGFVAQEVQKIFPEAVGKDDDGYLNFNIHPILIATVNAIQEQQVLIDSQKNIISTQGTEIELLKSRIDNLEKAINK